MLPDDSVVKELRRRRVATDVHVVAKLHGIRESGSATAAPTGVVEVSGFEPLTPCLQSRCSTS